MRILLDVLEADLAEMDIPANRRDITLPNVSWMLGNLHEKNSQYCRFLQVMQALEEVYDELTLPDLSENL